MTLSGALPPPPGHSPVAIVQYYLYAIAEKFPVLIIMQRHRNAPPPPTGGGLAQGGRLYILKWFFYRTDSLSQVAKEGVSFHVD
jgi:hypothetical protein